MSKNPVVIGSFKDFFNLKYQFVIPFIGWAITVESNLCYQNPLMYFHHLQAILMILTMLVFLYLFISTVLIYFSETIYITEYQVVSGTYW